MREAREGGQAISEHLDEVTATGARFVPDETTVHFVQDTITVSRQTDNPRYNWGLRNQRTYRRVDVQRGMSLTDFLAVLAYLEGRP